METKSRMIVGTLRQQAISFTQAVVFDLIWFRAALAPVRNVKLCQIMALPGKLISLESRMKGEKMWKRTDKLTVAEISVYFLLLAHRSKPAERSIWQIPFQYFWKSLGRSQETLRVSSCFRLFLFSTSFLDVLTGPDYGLIQIWWVIWHRRCSARAHSIQNRDDGAMYRLIRICNLHIHLFYQDSTRWNTRSTLITSWFNPLIPISTKPSSESTSSKITGRPFSTFTPKMPTNWVGRWINKSSNESISQSMSQSINHWVHRSIAESINHRTSQSMNAFYSQVTARYNAKSLKWWK